MKIKLFLFTLAFGLVAQVNAQVDDVSFFVTPTAGYNWFDSKTTIEDGLMYGVQAGFGFGQNLELRFAYERSSDLQQSFGEYLPDLKDIGINELPSRNVKVSRIGGAFKANIPVGHISPYIILGTGVQTFEREMKNEDVYKSENIYGTTGLGIKFNISQRLTFNLEGRAFIYNMNPSSLLLDPAQSGNPSFSDWLGVQEDHTMVDLGVYAGLQFYFGGTNTSDFSAMEKAYLNRFGSGLSDFKVTLAPAGAYVNFDDASPYFDTYMLGAELGVTFSDFVGLKAYYYRATKDEKISFDFDGLAMYGIDFVGRLNVARGIVPFITIGGGYINVYDDYQGLTSGQTIPSKFYAKGGLGLNIPLGDRVELFGAANLLYTAENDDVDMTTIVNTDQLRNHVMYNVGLRVKLGKRVKTNEVVDRTFNQRFAPERQAYNDSIENYNQRLKAYNQKIKERNQKIEAYEQRIEELKTELKEAFKANDEQKATQIIREKEELEHKIEKSSAKPQSPLIRMTPAELQSLIDETLENVYEEHQENSTDKRLDHIEQLLLQMNADKQSTSVERTYQPENRTETSTTNPVTDRSTNDLLIQEISELQDKINQQETMIKQLKYDMKENKEEMQENLNQQTNNLRQQVENNNDNNFANITNVSSGYNFDRGMSVYVGPTFGDVGAFNIGVRSYHAFSGTSIMFMPEFYVALGDKVGFGLSANGVLPININSDVTPYAGVGVGLHYLNEDFLFNPNFIVGGAYQLDNGSSLFVDLTVRGAFKNNQLAIGYRFNF